MLSPCQSQELVSGVSYHIRNVAIFSTIGMSPKCKLENGKWGPEVRTDVTFLGFSAGKLRELSVCPRFLSVRFLSQVGHPPAGCPRQCGCPTHRALCVQSHDIL